MKITYFILYFLFSILAYSCTNGLPGSTNENLKAVEFQKKMLELPDAVVIDVRAPEEFSNGHLHNAVNININSGSFESEVGKLDKNKPVFVYCLSGGRSSSAANYMRHSGFKVVYELSGGMMKWRAAGLPETKVHATSSDELSSVQFTELLNSDKLVLVDIFADWCAPCIKMAPFLEEIQNEMKSTVTVLRINADKNQALSADLNVTALPTLLLYKNKVLVWSNTGFLNKDEIKSHLLKKIP